MLSCIDAAAPGSIIGNTDGQNMMLPASYFEGAYKQPLALTEKLDIGEVRNIDVRDHRWNRRFAPLAFDSDRVL